MHGKVTKSRRDPVMTFDHDVDGVKTGTGWVKPDDGRLARDLKANGSIDTGTVLSDVVAVKRDGSKAKDGFDVLAELSINGYEVMNAKDAAFTSLYICGPYTVAGVALQI